MTVILRRALVVVCVGLLFGLAQAAPVTLRYAVSDAGESLTVLKRIVADFEAANPDVKIKIEPVVGSFREKLMAMVAARVTPDVARMAPQDYQPLAARGALLPLDEFIAKDKEIRLDAYYPNIVGFFRYEGKLYALPREVAPTGIVYLNKDLFRKAGIPLPSANWTWSYVPDEQLRQESFTWLARELTRKDDRGRVSQYGYASAWPQLMFETLMISRGVKMWDQNERPTRLNATDPEVVRLLNFASDFVNKHQWAPSQVDLAGANTSQRDLFLQGKLAMYQSGPWEILKFRKELRGVDWDILPFPAYTGLSPRTKGEGSGTSIFSATRYPEQSYRFVRWMSGPQGMTEFAKAGLGQPAIRALAMTPGVWLPAKDATGVDRLPANLQITDLAAQSMAMDLVPEYFRPIADSAQGIAFDVLSGVRPPVETLRDFQARGTRDLQNQIRRQQTTEYPTGIAIAIGTVLVTMGLLWIYWPEFGKKLSQAARSENRVAYLFLLPWIFGLLLTFGPMIYSFFLSFAESDMIQSPKWVGLRNYQDALFIDDSVPISIRQTFIFALFSIPLGVVSALLLALLLNTKVKGIPLYRAFFYLPSLASGVAMSLIWMRIFNPNNGLLNHILYHTWPFSQLGIGQWLSDFAGKPGEPLNWLANTKTVIPAFVIMGLWGAGGGTIIFLAGLQGIATQYYEAAIIDGASRQKQFWRITLPLLTPTIFFSLVTGVIGTLQVFTQAVVMTDGGPDRATLFYMVNLYRQAFQSLKMGYASALAWILFVIILIITVIQLQASKRWVHYEGDLK